MFLCTRVRDNSSRIVNYMCMYTLCLCIHMFLGAEYMGKGLLIIVLNCMCVCRCVFTCTVHGSGIIGAESSSLCTCACCVYVWVRVYVHSTWVRDDSS